MTCPHLLDVGAYVIDALEPEERLRLERHLATCTACAAEVRDLAALPALLASVPVAEPPEPAPVLDELAFRRLHRSATAVPAAPHRRVRRWLLAAAAVLVLGGAGTAGVVASSGGPTVPVTVAASQGSVHARATIVSTPRGSRITLALAGAPRGRECELTVQARDGHWETASSWTVDHEGAVEVSRAVSIRPHDLDQLVIRTVDGRTVVTMHT